ncbi:MAG: hypothetical protein IT209_07940 [Armatimonadetes bacterium]|nr:hypothetical protein [Armatimonadota bacterium]
MRVTLSSQTANAKYIINNAYADLARLQTQVATGKRIQKPSDDPVATNQSLTYSQAISDIDRYLTNTNLASDFLSQSSNIIDELYNQLQEVRTTALAANTATATAESRDASFSKLKAIESRLVDMANTTHLGRYIFSGQRTNQSPLSRLHTFGSSAPTSAASLTGASDLSAPISLGAPATVVFSDAAGAPTASVALTNGMSGSQIVDAVNAAFASVSVPDKLQASLDGSGHLTVTNTTGGYQAVVGVSATSDAAALTALGLSPGAQHGVGGFTPQASSGQLTINGVAIAVNAGDSAQALVDRINLQTILTKVTASVDAGGRVTLTQKSAENSSVMSVSASGGYSLADIFGASPSEETDSGYTYAGDSGAIKIQTGPFTSETVNRTADRIFNLDGAASASEPDVFTVVNNLAEAIRTGDTNQINSMLRMVDSASSRVMTNRVDLGARIQNLNNLKNSLTTSQDNLKDLRSKTEDADIAQVVVSMRAQEQVYQASLFSASSIFQLSLMDFLR